jgi:hypothetical protein
MQVSHLTPGCYHSRTDCASNTTRKHILARKSEAFDRADYILEVPAFSRVAERCGAESINRTVNGFEILLVR